MALKQLVMMVVWLVTGLWSFGCATPTRDVRAPEPEQPVLRVLSWNVNYGLAGDPEALRLLAQVDADLVFLQESSPAWERALRSQLHQQYPHMYFVHDRGAGGLAVLSRQPLVHSQVMEPAGRGWFPAWRVVAQTALGPVQVLQVHLRPPFSDSGSMIAGYLQSDSVHLGEISSFADPRQLPLETPTLVVGDFNEDSGGAAMDFLAQRGMHSALQEFSPSTTTWRWETALGEVTHTLDHMLYGPGLEPLEVVALDAGRSDHLPLLGIFAQAPQK